MRQGTTQRINDLRFQQRGQDMGGGGARPALTAFSLVPSIWAVSHSITHLPQRDAAAVSTAKLTRTSWTQTARRLHFNCLIGQLLFFSTTMFTRGKSLWGISLTALWREGSVEQVEALVSERFIRAEVKGQWRGVHSLPAAVWHRVTQSGEGAARRFIKVYNKHAANCEIKQISIVLFVPVPLYACTFVETQFSHDSLDPPDVQPVFLTSVRWRGILNVHRHDRHGDQVSWQRRLKRTNPKMNKDCRNGDRLNNGGMIHSFIL